MKFPCTLSTFFLVLTASTTSAETILVTSDSDSGPGSLREAITIANSDIDQDTVLIDDSIALISLTSGQLEVTEPLIIRGPGSTATIDAQSNSRIIAVTNPDASLVLRNLSLINGLSDGVDEFGDPLACLVDSAPGGAVCATGAVELDNVRVADSRTTGFLGQGGGLYADSAVIRSSTFDTNSTAAGRGDGAGVFIRDDATVDSSIFVNNSGLSPGSEGGGLYVGDELAMDNSIFENNEVQGSIGGGGGIQVVGFAQISNSSFLNNSAGAGGAIYMRDSIVIDSSTFTNNTADIGEGGALNILFADEVTISNSTVTGNASPSGGAVHINDISSGTDLLIQSSILADNTGPNGNYSETINSGGTILFTLSDSAFGDFIDEADQTSGTILLEDSYLLIGPSGNGCRKKAGFSLGARCVPTMLPDPGSLLVDAGANPEEVLFDQRGLCYDRVVGPQADIGAVELNPDVLACNDFE